MPGPDFALNHMVAPKKSLRAFMDMARSLGVAKVEIRNDLAGQAITDGTSPETVRAEAEKARLTIVSINALQRFNQWTPARADEAAKLIAYAKACGAKALVLCPVNDESFTPTDQERLTGLREALTALKPMLRDAGIVGLVEPLGFAGCSLRLKREAVEAIAAVDGNETFKLVHDTFHHHVAGETEIFPASTGLVHISGVIDPAVGADRMRDPHRDAGGRARPSRQCRPGSGLDGGRLSRPNLIRALLVRRPRPRRQRRRDTGQHGVHVRRSRSTCIMMTAGTAAG